MIKTLITATAAIAFSALLSCTDAHASTESRELNAQIRAACKANPVHPICLKMEERKQKAQERKLNKERAQLAEILGKSGK